MDRQTPAYMKDILPPGAPGKFFCVFLEQNFFSHQLISFLVAPVAWQSLILHEQMAGYK